jgi:3-oxoacyl-[acyl-carrier-protein] synthase-3
MAVLSYKNVSIAGISACVPRNVLRNEDNLNLDLEYKKQLIKTVGIEERRIADATTTTVDLCLKAAEKLIDELGWETDDIELLIFCSQSPDYVIPASSIILQDRLGLPKSCMAFDISLGCSGYTYALSIISSLLNSGSIKKGLLLCGDKSSISTPATDKSTYPLFGDAGSATALIYNPNIVTPMLFNLYSNGAGFDSIIIHEGGCRIPFNKDSLTVNEISPGIARSGIDLVLRGDRIFDFTINEVVPSINNMLNDNNLSIDAIDWYVFHQANLLLNETARKLLKIPSEKVPYSLQKYGNTSSASIPLTIVTQKGDAVRKKSQKYLFCGFGVGLSWATAILDMNHIVCPSLVEYE